MGIAREEGGLVSAGERCFEAVSSLFDALRAWGGLPDKARR